ncbi:unnamed protein product [Prunus armeniaca]
MLDLFFGFLLFPMYLWQTSTKMGFVFTHYVFRVLRIKKKNIHLWFCIDLTGRLPFFLAYVAFGFFNSRNTGGFLNTRKVFFEYHNVPMDTLKVITALSTVGFLRKPICNSQQRGPCESSLCQFDVFSSFPPSSRLPPLVPFYRPRGTNRVGSVKASRTVWVGVTSHYSHLLNSTLHMPPQASFV